jgi:hypothetical protein
VLREEKKEEGRGWRMATEERKEEEEKGKVVEGGVGGGRRHNLSVWGFSNRVNFSLFIFFFARTVNN